MGIVGRFRASASQFQRDQIVVVETPIGSVLGVVLSESSDSDSSSGPDRSERKLLRKATDADLTLASRATLRRDALYRAVDEHTRSHHWPIVLLDVEELIEPGRAVAYYLGPTVGDHSITILLDDGQLDVVMQPAGLDPFAFKDPEPSACCSSSGGCGSCGDRNTSHSPATGGGCAGCAVASMVAARG
jgi:hypothetical protein